MAFTKAVAVLAFVAIFALGEGSVLDPCAPECLHEHTGAHFPHPQNCTLFYQCSHRIAHIISCPAGLYFNPTADVCDYPQTAGCTADPNFDCDASETTTAAPTEPPSQPPSTQEPAVETTTGGAIVTSPEAPTTEGECIPPCPSPNARYPHPRDCHKYFQCIDGEPFEKTCLFEFEYSPYLQFCFFGYFAGCTATPDAPCVAVTKPPKGTTPATETDEPETEAPTTEEPITEEPTTEEPTTEEPTTEEPTTEVPTTEDAIDTTPEAPTTEGDCIPPCPSPNARYAHPRDCHKYFQCVDGVPLERTCLFELEYSPYLRFCFFGYFAGCTATPDAPCEIVTEPALETTPAVTEEPTTEAPTTEEPTTEEPTTEEPTTEDPIDTTPGTLTTEGECVLECPSPYARFPDPRECNKYIQCIEGVPEVRTCLFHWEYNTQLRICFFSYFSDCTADPNAPCTVTDAKEVNPSKKW